jgi:outer membrane protein
MKRIMRRLSIAAFLLTASILSADTLTLADCEARSLAGNRALLSAQFSRDAARAAADAAYTLYLPSLTVSGGYSRTNPQDEFAVAIPMSPPLVLSPSIEDNFLVRAELRQNIFTGFRTKSVVAAAEAKAGVEEANVRAERDQTLYAVRGAYLALAQCLEAEAMVREMRETVKARLVEVNRLQAQGLAAKNDVLKADLALSQAEFEVADSAANTTLSRARLNLLIGLPLGADTVPAQAEMLLQETDGKTGPVSEAADAASRRAELHAAQKQVAAGEAGLETAAAGLYPALLMKGNVTFANPNPAVFPREARWSGTWEIGALLSIDLGAYPQTLLRMEEARLRLEEARSRYADLQTGLELEVLAARLDLDRAGGRLKAALAMSAQADENMRVVLDKNAKGLAVASDVLDARLASLRAKLILTQARYGREAARLGWLFKQGLSWPTTSR